MRGGPLVLLEVDGVIMPTRYNVNWASTKGNVLQNPDGDFMVALPCICLPRRAHDVLANYDVVGWRCDAGDPPVHYLSLTLKPGGTPILAAAAEIVATHQQAQHPTLAAPPHPEDPHAHAHAHVHAHNHNHAHAHAHPHAHAHNPAHDLQPVWPTDGLIGALQPPPVPGHFPMQPLAQPTTPLLAITGQPGGSNSGAGSDGSGFTLMTHKRVRVPVHSESSKKKYRYRLNCLQEGCDKEAVTSTSGERVYCKIHMRERGLMPKERMCQKEGCDKRAQKCAQDGLTRFCKRHMRELGMSPFEIICREEGCDKRAQSTFDGRYVYCHVHMREKGIPSKKNLCREAGCDREVQASADGQYVYCRTHMRLHGLVPR